MKNSMLVGALIVSTTVAVAALLNPPADAHRMKYSQYLSEQNELVSLLKLGDLAALGTEYHSLRVASYSVKQDKLVTIGAFGVVMIWAPPEKT